MGGGSALLVWVAGDVSGYEQVEYRVGDGSYETFVSSAALYEHLSGEGYRVTPVLLVPETLYEHVGGLSPCEAYRLIVRCKAEGGSCKLIVRRGGRVEKRPVFGGDKPALRLVEALERDGKCRVVPHPGIAGRIRVGEHMEGEMRVVELEFGERMVFEVLEPSVYLDYIYSVLLEAYEAAGRPGLVIVDATHGTNFAVLYTLLAATILAETVGAELRVYVAPVLGAPKSGEVVEVIDASGVYRVYLQLLGAVKAAAMLDERLLEPLSDLYIKAGRPFGMELKKHYGRGKRLLGESVESLWAIRSGQLPLIPSIAERLRGTLGEVRSALEEIRSRYLGDVESARRYSKQKPPVPLYTLLDATSRVVEERLTPLASGNQLEAMLDALRATLEHYPDRVLSVAREYAVLLHLAVLARNAGIEEKVVEVGKEVWREMDELLNALKLDVLERARQLRNKLMHGRLSREEGTRIVIETRGDAVKVEVKPGENRVIEKREVVEATRKLLEHLESLYALL